MPEKDIDMIVPDEALLSDKDVVSFYNAYYKALDQIKTDNYSTKLDNLLLGNKTIYNKTIIERKEFDDGFVDLLKNAFPAFLKISRDPKRGLKYEEDVVGIEKAHKITSNSIRHLASHTQFISKVEDDEITPSKLLVTFAEEDLAVYENRAYKTLVNNIITFLRRRQKTVGDNVESHRYDVINYNHKTEGDGASFDIDLNIKMTRPIEEDTSKARELLNNINDLLAKYQSLCGTTFMRALVNAKDVRSPLLKTNIFLHNADFQILYNTWVFLERYQTEPYNVNVEEFDIKDDLNVDSDLSKQSFALINELIYLRKTSKVEVQGNTLEFRNDITHEIGLRETEFKPGEFLEEDFTPSEVLLSKTLELYKTEYEKKYQRLGSKEVSARQTICDMLKAVNSINNNLFDYKDTDIDALSDTREEKLEAQKKRYEMLKVLREEKEIDLETTRLEEQLALEHLNSIERKLDRDLTRIDNLAREGLTNRYKAIRAEMLKERAEQFRRQKEVGNAHREELMARARERAIKIAKRGFHSKYHDKKLDRFKRDIYIYDAYPCDTIEIDLKKNETVEDYTMLSRRDYSNSNRLSLNEILDIVNRENLARLAILKAEEEKLRKEKALLSRAFKNKVRNAKEKRNIVPLQIFDDTETLDLSGTPKKRKFMHQRNRLKPIKPKKVKKQRLVGNTRRLVKKKKLEAQLRKMKSKKVKKPKKTRTLVSKKRIK